MGSAKEGEWGNSDEDLDDICGLVLSVRQQEDIIAIWNKKSSMQQPDDKLDTRIRDGVMRVLGISAETTVMEYKTHKSAMVDHSSFRNTNVLKG